MPATPNPLGGSSHPRSPNTLFPGPPNPLHEAPFHRRSPIRSMPGTLEPFDEEVEEDSQKLPDAQREAHYQRTAPTYTPYMAKLKEANEAPIWDNLRAALFSWLTLAGYIVFPGAFTSIKTSGTLASSIRGKIIQDAIKKTPFEVIAGLCCFFGTVGTSWLWYVWRGNAIWLVRHIFLPGLLHSLIGLITTLINIYTAQGGHWSVTAKITLIIIGICTGNMSVLYFVYNHWVVEKLKTPHDTTPAQRSHA